MSTRKAFRLAAFAAGGVALFLGGCAEKTVDTYQGYAEGEFVMVAAGNAGRLEKRWVRRGQQVEADAPLFALEQQNERAGRREAGERLKNSEARVKNAEARLANITGGRRAPEIEAIRAQETQAKAARDLSSQQLKQQERLFASGFIAQARLDEARTAYARDIARVEETEAQLRNARLAIGRDREIAAGRAEVEAARADVETARAVLEQSDWRLSQRAVNSPARALVHDTFYSEGEWVPAGAPVASLLPPGNIRLRFFVPEPMVGGLRAGQAVSASCDGCANPIAAKISYIARTPEYTPPVIYSRDSRAKLVFLIEAVPEPAIAARLNPGQPVDVRLIP